MATTKAQAKRYAVLDQCFRNSGRDYTIEQLIDICSEAVSIVSNTKDTVSLRTVRGDIEYMRTHLSAPIEAVVIGKQSVYRYSDPKFSINEAPFTEEELERLKSVLDTLKYFEGLPQLEGVEEILNRFQQKVNVNEGDRRKIIEFERNADLVGREFLRELFNAVQFEKALKVIYKPFTSEKNLEIIFHPHFLKQYNNRWFVIGHNPEQKDLVWTMALDRIISISNFRANYISDEGKDWEDYFSDFIGVTKTTSAEIVDIVFEVKPESAKYIETKPLHQTQTQLKKKGDVFEFKIKIIPNREFEQVVLSYGETLKVVSPSEIKARITSRIKASAEFYKEK